MGPLDLLTAPLRSLLGSTEDMERDAHTLLSESGELERQLEEAVNSIHHAAESMEHHVAVVETLAATVPLLAESVKALVAEMHALNSTLKPVASAERDLSKLALWAPPRRRRDVCRRDAGTYRASGATRQHLRQTCIDRNGA